MKKRVYLGIDVGGTTMKMAVVSSDGEVIEREEIDTEVAKGASKAFSRIEKRLPDLIPGDADLAGAGVGCARLVDGAPGPQGATPNLRAGENAPLARIAADHFGVYTIVDNDANAAAYGEYTHGAGRGAVMFICITLGTGVGGGIVTEGRILRGKKNYAGEIGHMTIRETGRLCKCGNHGCLEAYLGTDALVQSARKRLASKRRSLLKTWARERRESLTPKLIAEAAEAGDRTARSVFEEAGAHLGTALASLVNLLNPDVIALGGGVSAAFPLMEESMWATIRSRAFDESAALVTVVRAELGNDAGVIGMAMQALRDSRQNDR
ncbi:MAG: ROK family protein [bacterium]